MEEIIVIIAVVVSATVLIVKGAAFLRAKKENSSPCASCSSLGHCSLQKEDGSCGCSTEQNDKSEENLTE